MDQRFASQLHKPDNCLVWAVYYRLLWMFAVRDRGNRLRSSSRWEIRRGGLPGRG